ncbi:hypothetical protein N7478_009496 [Penicillium angulare]|uniref:uncharacterized protein n=1 Tax=Penicillium angulare TaxID=116970 RepID=UPI002540789C|nr:uncharacterized protein N7478_009496 [Penicillium angulare]KAJ5266688.1 hypothetical protein N7478_009496 [Penicillium angulare]
MLHSRLRPLPRRNHTSARIPALAPTPDRDQDSKPETEEEEDESSDDAEDLFGAFLPHLFPDDAPSFHGDPGKHLLYSSPRYGELEIMVPSYPENNKSTDSSSAVTGQGNGNGNGKNNAEEGRKLFAHFLWSSGMVVAEGVELAACDSKDDLNDPEYFVDDDALQEAKEIWSVRGEDVLELGAGAGLSSLICALSNACSVTITDHPSSPALKGAIQFNISHNLRNIESNTNTKTYTKSTDISIHPHEWGNLSDTFAAENKGKFTRIIAADCYWMLSQHENLCTSMDWFLAPKGKVWVVSSFHTGRAVVSSFFDTADEFGFVVERIWERDVVEKDADGRERRREWWACGAEGALERKRWCVVAVLKRREV